MSNTDTEYQATSPGPGPDPEPEVFVVETEQEVTVADAVRKVGQPDEAADRFSQQLAAERARRLAAEQHAQATALRAQYDQITGALSTVLGQAATAQREMQEALEAADYAKAGELQLVIGRLGSRIEQLEQGKASMEQQSRQAPAPRQPVDRETYLSNFHPQTQAYLRKHPECLPPELGGNPRAHRDAMTAHKDAVEDGLKVETPEYFAYIDRRLGHQEQPMNQQSPPPRRPMPSAPVSRETSSMPAGGGTKVSLTAGEARAATDGTHTWQRDIPERGIKKGQNIGLEEMARRKRDLQRSGGYDNIYI